MKIFSYDSKFSQVMYKIFSACFLNLLWAFCSLPIITIGASTTALYHVTLRMADDEESYIGREFFRGFKRNFKQATTIWIGLLFLALILGGDIYITYHFYISAANQVFAVICTIILAILIAASIVYCIVLSYVFPLIASVENTNFAMIKNSFFIGVRYLFCTILIFAIHFAMFFAVVAIFTPLIIFGEGLCALLCSYLLSNVIKACSYDPNAEAVSNTENENGENA